MYVVGDKNFESSKGGLTHFSGGSDGLNFLDLFVKGAVCKIVM